MQLESKATKGHAVHKRCRKLVVTSDSDGDDMLIAAVFNALRGEDEELLSEIAYAAKVSEGFTKNDEGRRIELECPGCARGWSATGREPEFPFCDDRCRDVWREYLIENGLYSG